MFIDKSMTKDVISIDLESRIADACELLARNRIRHLPVIDKDGRLVGIVTDRDIRSAMPSTVSTGETFAKEKARIAQLKVKDIMTTRVITTNPDEHVDIVARKLERYNVSALPVVDTDEKVLGMLTAIDLGKLFGGRWLK